jgi:hypothetical protein
MALVRKATNWSESSDNRRFGQTRRQSVLGEVDDGLPIRSWEAIMVRAVVPVGDDVCVADVLFVVVGGQDS